MAGADYIVVGGGSSGAVVARRLADSGASVILLEAGGPDRSMLVRVPGMVGVIHVVPQVKRRFDWGFYSTPQTHALQRKVPQVRGRVLGGSSSINGMLFVRGNKQNFDDWAADGCPGWSYADVLPSYQSLETWEDGASHVRGGSGPIRVRRMRKLAAASVAFKEALAKTAGVPQLDDYNGDEQHGVADFQANVDNGLRYSSSVSFLDGPVPPSLTVVTRAQVSRLLMDGTRVRGVEVITSKGKEEYHAQQEVILSAGVYGSPQILMLSGIGPADHLRSLGLPVLADLPVGENLHDHMFVPMTFITKTGERSGSPAFFARGLLEEKVRGNTWMGQSVFEIVAFTRSSLAGAIPDIQIHQLPWTYPSPNQDAPVFHKVDKRQGFTVMSTLIYPKSRGTFRLSSADPTAKPMIDPNYLAEPDDTTVLLDGMELIRESVFSGLMDQDVFELHPGPNISDRAALRRDLPNRATTVYHPVGTCRMGSDERAVVGPDLRVRGIDGVRVVDSSIMPSITGGNTNAPSYMIGEHAAKLILAERSAG